MDNPRGEWIGGTQTEVPHGEWQSFLDSFSRDHANCMVTVEVASKVGRLIEVERLPLKGITVDRADGNERIYVQMGDKSQENVTHTVRRPTQVSLKPGAQEELDIASADGTRTVVRIRAVAQGGDVEDMSA